MAKLKAALASQQFSAKRAAAKKRAQAAEEAKKQSIKASLSGTKKGAKKDKAKAAAGGSVPALKAEKSKATGGVKVESTGLEVKDQAKTKTPNGQQRKPTIPFDKLDTVLLLGEGNFSYAASLILPPHSLHGHQILATAFDTEQVTFEKYPDAKSHVEALRAKGARVEFGVDAGALEKCKTVGKGRRWSRVVFNFPHVGAGITDQDRNILTNQHMLLRFLRSAQSILTDGPSRLPPSAGGKASGKGKPNKQMRGKANNKNQKRSSRPDETDSEAEPGLEDDQDEDDPSPYMIDEADPSSGRIPSRLAEFTPPKDRQGSILVTLLTCPPYTLWSLPQLATRPPPVCPGTRLPQPRYALLRSFEFRPDVYEGYEHRRTIGWKEGVSKGGNEEIVGRKGTARTWEFVRREQDDDDE
ncbi:hypothetical protein IAU60_006670 [Kwoniella sp. DSM 27419]